MVTFKMIRSLGEGFCSVCRLRKRNTCQVQQAKNKNIINRRWCQECFEQANTTAQHSADISR